MGLIHKIICLTLLAAAFLPAGAQRKVSADVEVKTVAKGKLSTVTKSVYCTSNGRLVTLYKTPLKYYSIANAKGEYQLYNPKTNEVMSQVDKALSSTTDLVSLCMSGRIDDLGLGFFGYQVSGTDREDGYVRKTFSHVDPTYHKILIVYENYLPIYCEYTSPEGKTVSRKYLSGYRQFGRMMLPLRITDISYGSDRDSTVVRTIYSGVKTDTDDPLFDFSVPADAKPMKLEAEAK
ncbi:MAG: hypothetical protein J5640_01240 [Bacteroidales bacterium]|nr:hypothetical protein [Bacteroidales bacterium]